MARPATSPLVELQLSLFGTVLGMDLEGHISVVPVAHLMVSGGLITQELLHLDSLQIAGKPHGGRRSVTEFSYSLESAIEDVA